MPAFSRAQIEW